MLFLQIRFFIDYYFIITTCHNVVLIWLLTIISSSCPPSTAHIQEPFILPSEHQKNFSANDIYINAVAAVQCRLQDLTIHCIAQYNFQRNFCLSQTQMYYNLFFLCQWILKHQGGSERAHRNLLKVFFNTRVFLNTDFFPFSLDSCSITQQLAQINAALPYKANKFKNFIISKFQDFKISNFQNFKISKSIGI